MDQVEEVKKKTDIVELVGQYLELKRAGINYSCRCPFHQEKTPSFMVSPERQVFRCFGCGESGDAISFLQKMEGLSFPEALKILADRAGVQLQFSNSKEMTRAKSDKEKVLAINLLAAQFFKAALWSKFGHEALQYLLDRGLTEEIIKKFKIGYAPPIDQLERTFRQRGFSYQDLSQAGSPQRFKYRIMFPIFNIFGDVIGFSGRILENVLPKDVSPHPKYLNTPETPVFHKSNILYGLNFAKDSIRKTKKAIVVEGQMDVAMSHVAGVENVVASSGTALTSEHLKILGRYTLDIIFAFDEDEAGQKAAEKAVIEAYDLSLEPKLTIIEGYKDVGELAKENPQSWEKIVQAALPPIEWLVSRSIKTKKDGLSAVEKKDLVKKALPFLFHMSDEIEKAHYLVYLAQNLGVPEISVEKALDKFSRSQKVSEKEKIEKTPTKPDLEEELVAVAVQLPDLAQKISLPEDLEFQNDRYKPIYTAARLCYTAKSTSIKADLQKIWNKLPRETQEVFGVIVLKWDEKLRQDETACVEEFEALLHKIVLEKKENIKNQFAALIGEAERAGDLEKVKELMKKLQQSLKS